MKDLDKLVKLMCNLSAFLKDYPRALCKNLRPKDFSLVGFLEVVTTSCYLHLFCMLPCSFHPFYMQAMYSLLLVCLRKPRILASQGDPLHISYTEVLPVTGFPLAV